MLYVNKKLMDQFGYQVPTTWQEWAALGGKVATEHPGYIIGTVGDSFGHWLYLWPDQCPISQVVAPKTVRINATDVHCTRMASLLDPLIANKSVATTSIFSPDFAKAYGGTDDKVLLMPGPTWYAKDIFGGTLKIPAGEMTATMPLALEQRAAHDRPGRRRPVGRLQAHKEPGGRDRLPAVGHHLPRGQGEAGPAVAGVPVVRPCCHRLVEATSTTTRTSRLLQGRR